MPTYKISQLTTATAVSATNQFEINQNGTSKSVEVSVIDVYIKSISNLPVVVSVSSTTAAVRITQTGTGNALVVEDAANPDSTPFVIDTSGNVLAGLTTARATFNGGTVTPAVQVEQVSGGRISITRNSVNTTAPDFILAKTRGTSLGAVDIVSSGDFLGTVTWQGADGTNLIPAARIEAAVDGTPGLNDMPGRLVFSTTADGSSSPTERMRIGSTGNIGIGTAGTEPFTIRNLRNFSGATTAYGISQGGEIQSAVTSSVFVNHTAPTTQATAFTLSAVYHYSANSLTIGAGSAVTTQYGFFAGSSLTTATNNYGFYSDIASGTGRWNFYANGTAANYFAGQVQLGAGTVAAPALSTTGDTNTGIFFPAADTMAFAEGGAEVMRIDSSGNVGIGTTGAGSKLDVKGTLRLSGATSGYVGLAPAAAAGSTTYTLPAADGTSGQVLSTNGSGTLSWASSGGGFASGTAMLFIQTAAPTGWTKSTTHNNKALRIVSGAASSGGTVDFTTAFASQAVSGTVGSTTLSTTQIPSHTHTYTEVVGSPCGGFTGGGAVTAASNTGATGGGGSHNHSFTGTAINLAVQYVDAIIATKD